MHRLFYHFQGICQILSVTFKSIISITVEPPSVNVGFDYL